MNWSKLGEFWGSRTDMEQTGLGILSVVFCLIFVGFIGGTINYAGNNISNHFERKQNIDYLRAGGTEEGLIQLRKVSQPPSSLSWREKSRIRQRDLDYIEAGGTEEGLLKLKELEQPQ